jgi:hypothetical protein
MGEPFEPYTICPSCGRKVDRAEAGVHYAVELHRVDTTDATNYLEGMGGFYHENCPILPSWRSKPLPHPASR